MALRVYSHSCLEWSLLEAQRTLQPIHLHHAGGLNES
jgi:hypothetical protein